MKKNLSQDSDSDLEDLQHVIEESRTQLNVAENALNKKRKDIMGTGIYLEPAKYVSNTICKYLSHANVYISSNIFFCAEKIFYLNEFL